MTIASQLAADAVSQKLAGTIYVAGDPALSAAVARALEEAESPALRAWSLGTHVGPLEALSRIHLPVDDPRLDERVLLLSLTELGGYTLLGRMVSAGTVLAYHAADLDLVDSLTTALQTTYHLQPEVR